MTEVVWRISAGSVDQDDKATADGGTTVIREESSDDHEAIRALNEAAFGRLGEANLVDDLRKDGDVALSLVAVEEGQIVGHVLFSRMNAPFPAWGLGPVSVELGRQRRGIGSRMIRTGLDRARAAEARCVFVLGKRDYYTRFGFDPALARGFASPYAGPYLMALALDGALPTTEGRIEYAAAFGRLG